MGETVLTRRPAPNVRWNVLVGVLCLTCLRLLTQGAPMQNVNPGPGLTSAVGFADRRLGFSAARNDCVPPAIDEFPADFMTQYQRLHQAGVTIHLLVSCYMFLAITLVCDNYFVPACEAISYRLGLQEHVAGATFMAGGSSIPELATAFIAVFFTQGDIGVSTIVGSATYNMLGIIGFSGIATGMVVYLSVWPIFRDCTFYALSIAILIAVISDGKVYWYEASMILLLYIVYIVAMVFDTRLQAAGFTLAQRLNLVHRFGTPESDREERTSLLSRGDKEDDLSQSSDSGYATPKIYTPEWLDSEPESFFEMPESDVRRIFWVLALPTSVLLYLTIPDCRQKRWRSWYPVSFVLSVAYIGGMAYLLVWMVTIIGYTFGIPDTVMGLTFLAIGTSLPDTVVSVLVARKGHGDMAVSNVVGSNIFDMFALGLPWFIQTVMAAPGSWITINSSGMLFTALSLLFGIVLVLAAVVLSGWQLNRRMGAACLAVYVLFAVLACLYETGVFGDFNPDICPIEA
ncbi:sodium/potassium/calcium exchanger 5-like isoform X1 [Branchiostoma floridae x Branchiostoma belcheri]